MLTFLVLAQPLFVGMNTTAAQTSPTSQSTSQPQQTSPTQQPTSTSTLKPALAFGLAEDTPIRLRVNRNLSSGTEKVGDKVDFEVLEAVKVGGVPVIAQGATAIATVTEAKPKGRMGRSGKLNVNVDSVQLTSGEKVSLRAVKGGKGGTRTGAMTGAIVATSIVFFPAAPLFLFMKGKNIIIPKGTEITAYVAADTPLDQVKFAAPSINPTTAASVSNDPGASSDNLTTVSLKSNPEGADITIDGKYMGSTQSTLRLATGEHTVVIEKAGFKPWQRTIVVSDNSNINVEATLEKNP